MIFSNKKVHDVNIKIINTVINKCKVNKFLGLFIDDNLNFKSHIDHIATKCSKIVGILYNIKDFVPLAILNIIYKTLIYPNLLYAIELWGSAPTVHINKICFIQKKAIRLINGADYFAHTGPLFKENNLMNVKSIHKYSLLINIYKIIKNNFIPSILSKIHNTIVNHQHNTRLNETNYNFIRPIFYRLSSGQSSFLYQSIHFWNLLPNEIKSINRFTTYKFKLKKHILNNQNSRYNI